METLFSTPAAEQTFSTPTKDAAGGFSAPLADLVADPANGLPQDDPAELYRTLRDSGQLTQARKEEVLDLFDAEHKKGLSAGGVAAAAVTGAIPAAWNFGKGVMETAERGFEASPAGLAYNRLRYGTTGPSKQAAGELAASADALGDQYLQMAHSGLHKLSSLPPIVSGAARPIGKALFGEEFDPAKITRPELEKWLLTDVALRDAQTQAKQGQGPIADTAGLDADTLQKEGLNIDPETVANASQTLDPLNALPLGVGGEIAGKVLPKVLTGAGEAAIKGAGTVIKGVGTGIEATGKGLKTVMSGTSGAVLGHFLGHPVVGAIGAGVGPTALKLGGKALQAAGEQLVEPGPLLRFAGEAAKNAGAGAVANVPFALLADNDEQAGKSLGVGAVLGAAGGAGAHIKERAVEAGQKAGQSVMSKLYEAADQSTPVEDHPAFGNAPKDDALHQQALDTLKSSDPAAANLTNRLRAVLQTFGTELYLVPKDEYDANPQNTSSQGFFRTTSDGKSKVFVRSDTSTPTAIFHEPAHAIIASMAPEYRDAFYKDIQSSFSPDQFAKFKADYESRINEGRAPQDRVALSPEEVNNELGTELLSGVLRAAPLDRLPTPLKDKALRIVGNVLESTGLYKPEAVSTEKTPNVTPGGVKMSNLAVGKAREFFKNKAQSPEAQEALAKIEKPPVIDGEKPAEPPVITGEPPAFSTPPEEAEASPTESPVLASAKEKIRAGKVTDLTKDEAQAFQQWQSEVSGETPEQRQAREETEAVAAIKQRQGTPAEQPEAVVTKTDQNLLPEEPAATPPNLRVTPEQLSKLGKTEDRPGANIAKADAATVGAPEPQRRVFEQVRDILNGSTRQDTPVIEVTHNSVEPETAETPINREARRGEQENPEAPRKEATKTLIPLGFTDDGKAIFGMSVDKVLAGVDSITRDAASKGVPQLVPYALDKAGNLTPGSQTKFFRDLASYTENQANGFRGDGKELIRPLDYSGRLPERNAAYTPRPLSDQVALFLNAIVAGGEMGPPKTSRVRRDKLTGVPIRPKNLEARDLAAANLRPALKPGIIESPDKQIFKDFGGVEIAELNSLRKQLEEAGVNVRKNIIGAPERINLEDITSVKERPDLRGGFQAPAPDLVRASFMPARSITPDHVAGLSSEEFSRDSRAWEGGLTGQAIRMGKTLKTEDLPRLQQFRDDALQKLGEYRGAKDIDGALAEASRAQFWREASEAARAAQGEEGLSIRPEDTRAFMPSRENLPEENPSVRNSFMQGFFSQLGRTVASDKFPNTATPEQVRGILSNPQNGIKADELKWSGVDEFLSGKSKVTKQELQDFLASNQMQIKEVTKTAGHKPSWEERTADEGPREWGLYDSDADIYAALISEDLSNSDYPFGLYRGDIGSRQGRFKTLEAAQNAGNRLMSSDAGAGETKFSKYVLPGGKNYREVLFTLPANSTPEWNTLKEFEAAHKAEIEKGRFDNPSTESVYSNLLRDAQNSDTATIYRSAHWEEKNVLAHARTAEHETPDGKKVLLAEEIQSDWHQEGRKKGYRLGPAPVRELHEGDIGYSGGYRFAVPDFIVGDDIFFKTPEEAAAHANLAENKVGVPDAPFKNTWHEFVFKTLLRDAVAKGDDYLAWTPGDAQAERYDLSKQVDAVTVHRMASGEYQVSAKKDGERVVNEPAKDLAEVEKLVGKELAAKSESLQPGQLEVFSGNDLKIGGHGMAGFYDKILVNFANKYGKKWGAKVEKIPLAGNEPPTTGSPEGLRAVDRTEAMGAHRRGQSVFAGIPAERGINYNRLGAGDTEFLFSLYKDPKYTFHLPEEGFGKTKVWALPITDAMRQSVEKGQPLFMPKAASKSNFGDAEIRPAIHSALNAGHIVILPRNAQQQNDLSGLTIKAR